MHSRGTVRADRNRTVRSDRNFTHVHKFHFCCTTLFRPDLRVSPLFFLTSLFRAKGGGRKGMGLCHSTEPEQMRGEASPANRLL